MKNKLIVLLTAVGIQSTGLMAQTPGKIQQTQQVLLPNGWKLSPAGRHYLPLGDLPLNMQLAPSGKLLAVTNNGQSTQSVQLIDPKSELELDRKELGKSWYGLAFSHDEKHLYVAGGNDNVLLNFTIRDRKLGQPDTIRLGQPWPKEKICPTGIAVTRSNRLLYTVTKEDSCLYTIEPSSGHILNKTKLQAEAYSCILSPDEKTLYISLWGSNAVAVYNTESHSISATIKTESHPNEILLNHKGTLLYVANANDNSVSVISTTTNHVIETLSTTLYPTRLTGSTTNGLTLSANEKTLYIANADNNCLAVFDVSTPGNSKSRGFIPVGWYPTNVKTLGNTLLVANGKGFTSMANPLGPQPVSKADNSGYQKGAINSREQYIGGLFKGTLSFIDMPQPEQLKAYTRQVYANTPFNTKKAAVAPGETNNPIPRRAGEKSPIL